MKCCYPNCFECTLPDCINDRLEIEDFKPDIECVSREVMIARVRANRYAQKNRKKIRETSLAWYYEHHEEQKERSRQWASENKRRVAAKRRQRWAENPEHYRQKQREYRARRKLQHEAINKKE